MQVTFVKTKKKAERLEKEGNEKVKDQHGGREGGYPRNGIWQEAPVIKSGKMRVT